MQVYSGTTNPLLAQKIATSLNCPLGKIELERFPNDELRVWIPEKPEKEVAVVQSFSPHPNDAIIELCLITDSLRRSGAKEITHVIPWLGYSIQDKIFRQGEPLSARVIADLIQTTKPDKIITLDLHNEAIQGFFSVPIIHLSALPLFIELITRNKPEVVVAPDIGALKESTKVADLLKLPIAVVNKKRDLVTGEVSILGIEGEIKGKTALICDDFISTGSTLINTAKVLKDQGVEKIVVSVTHHLFIKGVQEKLAASGTDELYITDTITPPPGTVLTGNGFSTQVVSVAELIGKYL